MAAVSDFLRLFLVVTITLAMLCDARIRYKYRKRPECRDNWPRRQSELPAVVVAGLVQSTNPPSSLSPFDGSELYSASVYVKWVFRGPKRLQDSRITIEGFGNSQLCHSDAERLDVWILMLDEVSEGLLRLNGTLHKVNLNNLDRIKALTRDEPYRRRPDITELPCETQYCENNGNCVEDSSSGILTRAKCRCLDSCPSGYEPVCGSNYETFPNQCRIRMDSCLRGHNYFIRFPGDCSSASGRRPRSLPEVRQQLAFLSH